MDLNASPEASERIVIAARETLPSLIPILLLAEESQTVLEEVLRDQISDDGIFALYDGNDPAAVATVDWRGDAPDAEIVHLAVAPTKQRRGLGSKLIRHVVNLCRSRGKKSLVVGTADVGVGNIKFYLRQGFRMDEVKRDYFVKRYGWNPDAPEVFEDGIPLRDAIFFRMEL